MNIEEILDDMDDLLDRSRPIPFAAHKAVIDADRMRELLNSAHLNIPAEIKRAKLIDSDCDRIMNEARQKAEAIIQDAETRAKRMLSEQAILQDAKKRALDMLTKAQNGSNDIKDAAEKYVAHLLEEAQDYFQNAMTRLNTSVSKVNRTPARTIRPTTAVMIRVFIVSCSPLFRPGAAPLLWQGLQRQRLRKYRTLSGGRARRAASCVSFAALKVRRSGGSAG